jgi:hypothetical protein
MPATGWFWSLHEWIPGEWWFTWRTPGCDEPIAHGYQQRFGFDNPNSSTWSDWTTTFYGTMNPRPGPAPPEMPDSLLDWAENHNGEPNGQGYLVHAPICGASSTEQTTWGKVKLMFK